MRMSKEKYILLYHRGYKITVRKDLLVRRFQLAKVLHGDLPLGKTHDAYVADSFRIGSLDIGVAKPALTGGSQNGVGQIGNTVIFQNQGSYPPCYKRQKYYR